MLVIVTLWLNYGFKFTLCIKILHFYQHMCCVVGLVCAVLWVR
jgi:hypothetical protein